MADMIQHVQILLVENNASHAALIKRAFKRHAREFVLTVTHTVAETLGKLDLWTPDLMLLALRLPDGDGSDLLPWERACKPHFPVILLTEHHRGDLQKRSGSIYLDYVIKSAASLRDMVHIVDRTLQEWRRIAELEGTRKALEEAEGQWNTLVRKSPDIIYRLDSKGNIQFISNAVTHYGYEIEELLGKSIFNLVHPDDLEKAKNHLDERRTGPRRTKTLEIRLLTRNSETVPFELHSNHLAEKESFFLIDAEGLYRQAKNRKVRFVGTQGVARDITHRKIAEDKIQELNRKLEQKVVERTQLLEATQKELIEKAHKAGMADIASSTLHNVGNILNSVTTSSQLIDQIARTPSLKSFKKANHLLKENRHRLDDFMENDPRGQQLVDFYLLLEEQLELDQERIQDNARDLAKKIGTIRDVITAQQGYAFFDNYTVTMGLQEILEDAFIIQASPIERDEITLVRQYHQVSAVAIQKTKLMHILVNLLKNARESIVERDHPRERTITALISEVENRVSLTIKDTGKGVEPVNMNRIFNHGFTTKPNGHGFGLHACANAMSEMGGLLRVESEGLDKGAAFIMEFPIPLLEEADSPDFGA